ncbi:energy transducer TonB [Niabella ginsengisoli]|uniref:Energy transducer TonB n=1 Tax=Niabella ginsengisoli TaxID=522298 RepID=A0ABS9SK22_9BACT|nr:energy transducer TonB [Niabella ginsengisoli]MCH5598709.1 energy transducer TonB [Niabella ginsengisoli]
MLPVATIIIALFGFTYKKEIKEAVAEIPAVTTNLSSNISTHDSQKSKIKIVTPKTDTIPSNKRKLNISEDNIYTPIMRGVTLVSYSSDSLEDIGKEKNEVYTLVNIDASYPGGQDAWKTFLMRHIDADIPRKNGAPVGNYNAIIQFRINKNGEVNDVKAVTEMGFGMEEEAIKVIKKSDKWNPAILNGVAQTSYRKQQVSFQVLPKKIHQN